MKVYLKNCNNIDSGDIEIKENYLNIKYAINGTGKSTISNAIEHLIKGTLNELIPFKYYDENSAGTLSDNHRPTVEIFRDRTNSGNFKIENSPVKSVKVFNEAYVNEFTFVGDEVVKNSFEIYIKTPVYESKMNEITSLIAEVKKFLENFKDLDDIIKRFDLFLNRIVKPTKQKAYSKTGSLGKALSEGNKTADIPTELIQYKCFITRTDCGQWASWQKDGNNYFDWDGDHANCPYCATAIESENKQRIEKISKEFDSAYLKNLQAVLAAFSEIKEFFDDSTKEKINLLGASKDGFTKNENELIGFVCDRVKALLMRLQGAKSISFETLKYEVDIIPLLRNNIIDLEIYKELDSAKTRSIVDALNESMLRTIEKATELKVAVDEQNRIIRETIEKNEIGINRFLMKAGYQYAVSIEEDRSTKKYRMLLKHCNGEVNVPQIKSHLSYGERNAFALALFMYDVLKENPDLVILDDPISSFDKHKKYAIMDMLFCGDLATLRGKTVVMLTHDFEPVSDVLKIHPTAFTWNEGDIINKGQFVQATFLRNALNTSGHSELTEKRILDCHIKNYLELLRDNSKNAGNIASKLIYLRRMKELEMDKGDVWNVLSSFFHEQTPVPVEENKNENKNDEPYVAMHRNKVIEAEEDIGALINDSFVYETEYQKYWVPSHMIDLYENTSKGYEKLQIFRCLSKYFNSEETEMSDAVFAKFINETYHAEMDYILQLNPREFEIVPSYILKRCDDKVMQFKAPLMAQNIAMS